MRPTIPLALAASALLALSPAPGSAQQGAQTASIDPSAAASSPVITVDGVAEVLGLDEAARAKIAPDVVALNAAVERLVELRKSYKEGLTETEREALHSAMKEGHAQLKEHRQAIETTLTPEQQTEFHSYLHERAKAAGLRMMGQHGDKPHDQQGEKKPGNHP